MLINSLKARALNFHILLKESISKITKNGFLFIQKYFLILEILAVLDICQN